MVSLLFDDTKIHKKFIKTNKISESFRKSVNMETVNERVKIVRDYFCNGINKVFAEKLGRNPNVTSNWVRDGYSVGAGVISLICETFGVSNTWLAVGKGNMIEKTERDSEYSEYRNCGIPLIPNDAFAGYGNYQYSDLPIEEFYQIREFQNASFLLRVSGDSMAPKYNGGSLIACQKIESVSFWQWHRIYAICTKNQGILIKRVEESENDDEIICMSENPSYRPFKLGKEEIVSVALVMGAIVLE